MNKKLETKSIQQRDIALLERDEAIIKNDLLNKTINSLKLDELAREEFVATLTHDIRNPISIIKVAFEALQTYVTDTNDEKSFKTMIHLIERNIDTTEKLISYLLDTNLIKSGSKLPIKPEKCNILSITKDCINNLKPKEKARINLDTDKKEIWGKWDEVVLQRAFDNLISNAFKYGDKKGVIDIQIRQSPEQTSISFKNLGDVISLEDQSKIFHRYYRTDQHSDQQQGWGLGLTLVKGITESHNGKVEVISNESEGTIFTITLPNNA